MLSGDNQQKEKQKRQKQGWQKHNYKHTAERFGMGIMFSSAFVR